MICGPSASASAAVGRLALARGLTVDSGVVLSASVNEAGTLGEVGEKLDKVAALQPGRRLLVSNTSPYTKP